MSTNELIERLDETVRALGAVDPDTWSDLTLRGHLDELSAALVRVDGELARLADAVRARGLRIAEPAGRAPAARSGRRGGRPAPEPGSESAAA